MADHEVVLIDFWPSPYAMRVKVALAVKGIEYESKMEDFLKRRGKSSLLMEMNPVHKLVPVLIHNGRPVSESSIILQYIDEVWNHQPPLFPSHPYELAHVRFWSNFIDKKIFLNALKVSRKLKGKAHEEAKKDLIEGFKLLEGELGGKTYLGGEKFGVLDVILIPLYSWFYAIETYGSFSMVEECPKIMDWAKRCLAKDSVSKSLPDQLKVYEFSLEKNEASQRAKSKI